MTAAAQRGPRLNFNRKGITDMKKLISAVTSFAMAASMAASVAPIAVVNAADAQKTLTIGAYAQSGSAYANQGSSIKISEADIAAGDVTVPCAVYLSEQTADTQTMAIPLTIDSDQADVKNVKFDLIDPQKAYFDSPQQPYDVPNAVVFASEWDELDGYTPTGINQLTCDTKQDAAGAKNYYIGYGWTAPYGYKWTGEKSDDYPVFVFDVTFPKGTAAGDYNIHFCDYIKDAQGNPSLMLETDDRYTAAKGNLKTQDLTIHIAGDAGTTVGTTTTAPATTTTVTTTTSPLANDYDVYFDFGNYTAKPGDEVTVDVILQSENSVPVASIDSKFKVDSPLSITAIGKKSEAYSTSVESNLKSYQASFISLDNSEPVVGKNGSSVFKFVVKVPEDCAEGSYKIGFDSCEIFKQGKNSDTWTWYASNGNLVVSTDDDEPGNTGTLPPTTTTTPVSTTGTTTSQPASADVVFDFGSYSVKAGETVTVDVLLKSGKVGVASMDVKYKLDSPLTITNFGKKSEAYGTTVDANPKTYQQSFISIDQNSDPVVGEEGKSIFKFVVQIPEDCESGTYLIGFDKCEIYKSGQNSDMWMWGVEGGTITVDGKTPESTDATTTSVTTSYDPTLTSPIEFDFGSYSAKAGETVTVDVLLSKGDVGVASMDVKYKVDTPLTITTFGKKSEAYGATVDANPKTYQQSFISIDQNSDPVVGTTGKSVFKLVVTIPEDCPDGTYKIGFDSCDIFKSGQNSEVWGWSAKGGYITVGDVEVDDTTTTTTTTTPVSTTGTTTPQPISADVVFDFGTYSAKAGETVTVDVLLKSGKVGVASMDVKYKLDSPLTITNFGKKSEAYGTTVDANPKTYQQSFISIDQNSDPVVGEEGKSIFKFVVQIPEDCESGTYLIGFDKCEIYKSGQNSDMWMWGVEGGTITVDGKTSDTTSTTTTTDSPSVDSDIVFDFGNYEANAGDTVTVDVLLKSGKVGVASMDVKYKVDSPLTITSFGKKSEAYGTTVDSNPKTYQQSFISIDQNSDPVVGEEGKSIFKFVITIPETCTDGLYNIGFENCEIYKSGANSDMWKWSAVGGTIKVGDGGTNKAKYSGVGDLDRNKKVVAVDASLLLAYVADINAGTATVTDEDMWICDVNRDGKITSVDASIILTYYADVNAGYTGSFVDYLVEKIGVERSSVEDQ